MALGWKSLTGIVGAASVVSVGTFYSVLLREPAAPTPTAPQASSAPASQPASAGSNNPAPASQAQASAPASTADPSPSAQKQASAQPSPVVKPEVSGQAAAGNSVPQAATSANAKPDAAKLDAAKPDAAKPDAAKSGASNAAVNDQAVPSFDIARIEPGGDAVIAGRAAPGATVELLRNGNSYARGVADVGGQWAIVPPTLPKGTCELTLRSTTPDGHVAQSQQTVSVRVPEQPGEEVVVVLNTPDQPSKVLTDAAPPAGKAVPNPQVAAAQPTQAVPADGDSSASTPPVSSPTTPKADGAKTPTRANAAIRTVEADEAGRFFVTGMAEPGASLRIYLNDTLVTTVTAAKDGSFGMTIEKGMAPGDYKIRVDDVAAGSGQVLTRAEVPFAMAEKASGSSAPTVVAAAGSPGKSALPGARAPAAGAVPVAAPGSPGSVTPASAQPTSIVAPDAAATAGSPTTSTGATPAAAGTGQGASSSGKATPAANGTRAAPGSQPVEVADAKPAAPGQAPSMAVIPEIRTTTIVKGDNLWRLSRKIYGQGTRYTWIYDANTDQIRNPNLIYPGQVFVMPDKKS